MAGLVAVIVGGVLLLAVRRRTDLQAGSRI
jgi:hypothetical protein